MCRLLALLFVSTLNAAGLPDWLQAYPGAKAESETVYTASVKPEAVIEHYQRLWASAGLPFAPNFNGIGTSIRAALADCDLLVQVREQGEGSHVKATCAARNAVPDPNAGREVITSNGSVNGRRIPNRSVPLSQRDPDTAAVLAKAAEADRERTSRMAKYDEPVFPKPPRDPDGIPLRWPSWFVHMPGASSGLAVKASVNQDKKNILTSNFRSVQPMSEIYDYYKDLMEANGFRVGQASLGTGQTLSGVMQNKDGMVKGTYEPYGIGKGGMSTTARFSRTKLNEPIRVVLEVKLIQIYSSRW